MIEKWLLVAFCLGILCGGAVGHLYRLARNTGESIELRRALGRIFLGMSADAHDLDGFTDNQIDAIKTYGHLIGVSVIESVDKWEDKIYRFAPKLSEVVRELEL